MGSSVSSKILKRTVLMVDDDLEDILLTREALEEVAPEIKFRSLNDGQEMMDYLFRVVKTGGYADEACPELILLDLNMPRKNGFEVLIEMRNHADLRRIPVIVLSTSTIKQDINRSFDLGANSFLSKPQTYEELLTVMSRAVEYWFGISRLPMVCLEGGNNN